MKFTEQEIIKAMPVEWQAAFDVTRNFRNAAIYGVDLIYLPPQDYWQQVFDDMMAA